MQSAITAEVGAHDVNTTADLAPGAHFEVSDAKARTTSKVLTRYLPTGGRVLLGVVFFVCGLNGFFNFLPMPKTPPPDGAMALAGAFMKAGYLFPLIKGTEVLASVLLLSNRFVPLALALLAPVVVNIVAFHAFLAPEGVIFSVVLLALEIYLAWTYRSAYRPMLAFRDPR